MYPQHFGMLTEERAELLEFLISNTDFPTGWEPDEEDIRDQCERRRFHLRREEFGPPSRKNSFFASFLKGGPKGKFVDRSRCWPNGSGLEPRITEGHELVMGSLASLPWRNKESRKWRGSESLRVVFVAKAHTRPRASF